MFFSSSFAFRHGVIDEILYNALTTCIDMPMSGICMDAKAQYSLAKANLFDEYNVYGVNGFTGYDELSSFLCNDDVQKALHVDGSPNASPICNWVFETPLGYRKMNVGCSDIPLESAGPDIINIADIYRSLAGKLRIVLYNGDVDPAVDTIGSQRAAYAFGMPVKAGGEWRPWIYNETGAGEILLEWKFPSFGQSLSYSGVGEQLGGYVVNFEGDFTYLTFHGSGHMVPEYKPQAALSFFKHFINDEEYAPPLVYPDNIDEALYAIQMDRVKQQGVESAWVDNEVPHANEFKVLFDEQLQKHHERIHATMEDDAINSLPDVEPLHSRQFSGFLGLEGSNEGSAIHYWHVEAEDANPDEAPLVIWLNGGPGGSSMGGAVTEQGPFIVNRTGFNLIDNPYAWTGPANMLFLESPPGCCPVLNDFVFSHFHDGFTVKLTYLLVILGFPFCFLLDCKVSDSPIALSNLLTPVSFVQQAMNQQQRPIWMRSGRFSSVSHILWDETFSLLASHMQVFMFQL